MDFIIYSYLSGIVSAGICVFIRLLEIKNKTLYIGKQIFVQIGSFLVFFFLFSYFFSSYTLNLFGESFSWFWIFFIVSNLSFYIIRLLFEWYTGISFYPTDKELEDAIKKKQDENDY